MESQLGFDRPNLSATWASNWKTIADAYSFTNFVKEIFFDSETSMSVISGVPGRETNKNHEGQVLEGRSRGGGLLPSWLMSKRKNELNQLAGGQRAFCQGNCAPNHYWDRSTNKPNFNELFEQMVT